MVESVCVPLVQRTTCGDVLVCFLGHAAHLGLDVAQQEESNSGDATGDLCYPEGHFPAMVLGNSAEWEPRQKATNWREHKIISSQYGMENSVFKTVDMELCH